MGNEGRVTVSRVELAWESQTTDESHREVGCSGGVRFWGTAARIEPACSMGKQNCCNSLILILFGNMHNRRLNVPERHGTTQPESPPSDRRAKVGASTPSYR